MPIGVYKHQPLSKETKEKLSKIMKEIGNKPPSNLGKSHSEETKKKMSLSSLGRKKSKQARENIRKAHLGLKQSPETIEKRVQKIRGKKLSLEHRQKISIAQKGEKSHLWKGGVTLKNAIIRTSFEYRIWREAVFKRDGWKCIWCGSKIKLNADHIKPFSLYPELRLALDNGRTLCESCHRTTETFGLRMKKYKII